MGRELVRWLQKLVLGGTFVVPLWVAPDCLGQIPELPDAIPPGLEAAENGQKGNKLAAEPTTSPGKAKGTAIETRTASPNTSTGVPGVPGSPPAETTPIGGTASVSGAPIVACPLSSTEPGDGPGAQAKPWTLPRPELFKSLGITWYGWVEQGFTANALSPSDRSNGPIATNDRSNDYQLNQTWLTIERKIKTDGHGFDLGGHIDACYGTDWRFGDCPGLESEINSRNSQYGLILPQFYVEAALNDLTVRAGHFAASIGYEIIPPVGNFFYSHSYAMAYSEPILVTGIQANYKCSDNFSIRAGMYNGWSQFEDWNQQYNCLTGFMWTSTDKKTDLSFVVNIGPQNPRVNNPEFAYALVLQHQFTENLKYVAQNNLGFSDHGDPRTSGYASWYGLDQYLFYKINSKLTAGVRFEWFDDVQGSRVAGVGNLNNGWNALPGFEGNFFALTTGVNWRFHPNCNLRPELRYDWYSGTRNLQGQLPFGDGRHSDQFLAAVDLIFMF